MAAAGTPEMFNDPLVVVNGGAGNNNNNKNNKHRRGGDHRGRRGGGGGGNLRQQASAHGTHVPNVYWRARTHENLRQHPNFISMPDDDDTTQPPALIRQATDAWVHARRGVVTTSRMPALLGFYEPNSGMQKLVHLPRVAAAAGRLESERDELVRANAEVQHELKISVSANLKARLDQVVVAHRGNRRPSTSASRVGHQRLSDDQLAECVRAAAVGTPEVACLWGKAQEPAALLAVLEMCPKAVVVEVGLLEIPQERVRAAVVSQENDGAPPARFGASPDGVICWDTRVGPGGEAAAVLSKAHAEACKKARRRIPSDPAADAIRTAAAEALGNIDVDHVAMLPLEVKCRCPFYAGAGRRFYVNSDIGPQGRTAMSGMAPAHYPQLQLECASLGATGGVLVYHTAHNGSALYHVPANPSFLDCIINAASITLAKGAGGEAEAGARRAIARRARRGADSVTLICETRGLAGARADGGDGVSPSQYFTQCFLPADSALKRVLASPWSRAM